MTLTTSNPCSRAWSEEMACKIARKVAVRSLPLFSAWPEFGKEDLFAEAPQAIRANHHRFNPDYRLPNGRRVAYSTFAYTIGKRRLIDQWRARGQKANYEQAHRETLSPVIRSPHLDDSDLKDAPDAPAQPQLPDHRRSARRAGGPSAGTADD